MFNNVVRMVSQKFELGDKSSTLVQIVVAYITNEQSGGLASFMEFVKAKGLGNVAKDWVNSSVNEVKPLEAFDVLRVFGDKGGLLDAIARRLELDRVVTASAIGLAMPKIVSMLTPDGELPTTIGKDIMEFASKGLNNVKDLFGHSISIVGGAVSQSASKIGGVSKVATKSATTGISNGAVLIGNVAKNSTKSTLSSIQSATAKMSSKATKDTERIKQEIAQDLLTPKNSAKKDMEQEKQTIRAKEIEKDREFERREREKRLNKESNYNGLVKIIPFIVVAGLLGWFLEKLFFGVDTTKNSDIMLSDINRSEETIQDANRSVIVASVPTQVELNLSESNDTNLSREVNGTLPISSINPVALGSGVVAGGVVGTTSAINTKKVILKPKPKVKVWTKVKPKVKPKVVKGNIQIKDNRVNNASISDKDIEKLETIKSEIVNEPIDVTEPKKVVQEKPKAKEERHERQKPKVKRESPKREEPSSSTNNADSSNGDGGEIFFHE